MNLANRLNTIQEYYFSNKLREIAELKKNGVDVINLGIGNPDLPPAKEVIENIAENGKSETKKKESDQQSSDSKSDKKKEKKKDNSSKTD